MSRQRPRRLILLVIMICLFAASLLVTLWQHKITTSRHKAIEQCTYDSAYWRISDDVYYCASFGLIDYSEGVLHYGGPRFSHDNMPVEIASASDLHSCSFITDDWYWCKSGN